MKEISEKKAKGQLFGVRHLQCILLFLSLASGYSMRANLFAAVVSITDGSGNPDFEEYEWPEKTKSYILSSFFWGYCITQIPGGHWAVKFGAKTVLLFGVLISAILCFLTPYLIQLENLPLLCLLRMSQGLSQGVVFPSTHAILSNWAPLEERGSLCAFIYSGTLFGVVLMYATSGIIAASPLGWPGIFYVCGVLGLLWVVAWIIWGAKAPEDYVGISTAEKILIESSLNYTCDKEKQETIKQIPWTEILRSPSVLLLFIVHCTHNFGFVTMLVQLPTYLNRVLDTDIKQNAILSALPYFAMLILSFFFSFVSNVLAKRHLVSISTNRKLLNSIGQWVPAVGLLILAYCVHKPDQINLAVFLLVVVIGVNSASFSGFQVNHIDLSPNYAGVLMGITHCGANIISVIAPLVVGLVVYDETDPYQWRIVFCLAAGSFFFGNLLFIIFGKTDVQKWNEVSIKESTEKVDLGEIEIQKWNEVPKKVVQVELNETDVQKWNEIVKKVEDVELEETGVEKLNEVSKKVEQVEEVK